MKKKNNKGFSMLELIISIAILVILAGLLAPQLIKYVEKSREARDMQTIDNVYMAVNTAMANEKAYREYSGLSKQYTNNLENGVSLPTIMDTGEYGDLGKEITRILNEERTEIKLVSKRALGTGENGKIFVQIRRETDANGNVYDDEIGFEIAVYAGTNKGEVTDSDFKVGIVDFD